MIWRASLGSVPCVVFAVIPPSNSSSSPPAFILLLVSCDALVFYMMFHRKIGSMALRNLDAHPTEPNPHCYTMLCSIAECIMTL